MTLGRQMYLSRCSEIRTGNENTFRYLLVSLKAKTAISSRLRIEVFYVDKGEPPDGQMEDDRLPDIFEDDISVSSEEDIADETTNASISSEDDERRENHSLSGLWSSICSSS